MLQHALDSQLLDDARSARLRAWSRLPAAQQPSWDYHPDLEYIRARLTEMPGLVDQRDTLGLRGLLARVEAGSAHLLHVGECAETFPMSSTPHIESRLRLYRRMAERLSERTGREVVLLTRMAGQHAKPRSQPTETVRGGEVIPSYRGDAVNGVDQCVDARRFDPWRMLASYEVARDTLGRMVRHTRGGRPVFVSHEALLRDYEEPLTRGTDVLWATSGHLVWIGDRTRKLWNWHVQWAKSIVNPIGVKVGPTATPFDVFDLVRTLNPGREPGRLNVITRFGVPAAGQRIGPLVNAVVESRSPVLWQCDPMHGNTRKLGETKLRLLPDLRTEISTFVRSLRAAGCHPGGLHLEVTPEDVHECHEDLGAAAGHGSRPPCDPRLNPRQAMAIVDHFADEVSR